MKGSPEVIAALASALAEEAHLNMQYRKDWRVVRFMGAKKTARKLKRFGCDAHAWQKKVTDRLLLLGGEPQFDMDPVTVQRNLTETFKNELALEMAILAPYEQAIQISMKAFDDGTRNLFEHLIKWHQGHVGYLEQQLTLIAGLSEAGYIAEKL